MELYRDLAKRRGGFKERKEPAVFIVETLDNGGPTNLAHVYDAAGVHMASVGWRPHEKHIWGGVGLLFA